MKTATFVLLAFAALATAIPAAAPPPAPPDLTKGERDPQEKRTYNLGATGLMELIVKCNTQVANKQFPGDCNKTRVGWVEDAIAFIEAAKEQPELRNIAK